ncbi:uncharacterized protein YneF (UPF0154 family) [Elusimicrobium simillimum]
MKYIRKILFYILVIVFGAIFGFIIKVTGDFVLATEFADNIYSKMFGCICAPPPINIYLAGIIGLLPSYFMLRKIFKK